MTAGNKSRYLAIAGRTLLGIGLLIALFLFYQLFITDLINARSQDTASDELAVVLAERREELPNPATTTTSSPTTTSPSSTTTTSLVVEPPELLAEPVAATGEPFARLIIDSIQLDAVVFEGVDRTTLKLGPGHMPGTPLPGQPGNAVISGHRTTYGRPFFDLDLLVVGDEIKVETALGVSRYAVRGILVVAPTDVWVAANSEGAWLTLTTCHPQFSAAQRLIIQAELIDGPNLDYVEAISA